MGYRHEVTVQPDGLIGVMHYRVSAAKAGLLAVQQIGRTIPVGKPTRPKIAPSGLLVMPNIPIFSGFNPEHRTVSEVDCDNLRDMVDRGRTCWQQLLEGLVDVERVDLILQQITDEQETIRPSGLILPPSEDRPKFRGYYATPPEIQALEDMTSAVQGYVQRESETGSGFPGNYL